MTDQDAPQDRYPGEQDPTDEDPTSGPLADGSAADGTAADGSAADGTAADHSAADGSAGAAGDGSTADGAAPDAPATPARSSAGQKADELKDRSKRFLESLSARSRGEGWEKPTGELAKYRSTARSALRFVLQRVIFRGVIRANLTVSATVHRRVRTVRGPFVLVANHSSHIDAPMLAQGLPWAQARFLSTGVAADYFFTVWHRRLFVRLLFNAFPVDRGGSRTHAGTSRRLLRSGVPILVFPEGTRQKDGRMSEFKPGAAALAIGVGVPVVPAAIIGAHEAMPKGRSWPKQGRPPVAVVFGEPMVAYLDESAVEFTARIRTRVKDLYDEHHDEVLGSAVRDEEESA